MTVDSPPGNAVDGPEPASAGDADRCRLCDLPTPEPPITDDAVDGAFCCRGCLEVQRALGDLDDVDREAIRSRIESEDESESASDEVPSGHERAFLAVDGMHCSTCEAFLETRAAGVEGVASADASYATDTLCVTYDPDDVDEGDLPERLTGYGYEARDRGEGRSEGARGADLVKFLLGGGLFGMMVMMWYVLFLYPTYFGFEPLVDLGGFDGLYLFANLWLLTSLVLFYTGWPILRGAYVSLRAGRPNMDLLVALAAVSAYTYSTLAMAVGRTDLYFDVSVAIILVVTVGTWYESRVKRRAAGLLTDLTEGQVTDARRADGEVVPVESVDPGDRLLVKPGERVPVDGEVVEGSAAVDESLVTGESLPVSKGPGDALRGGTVVTDAPLHFRVGPEAESTLDRLVELLWRIQSTRPGVQRLADKLATVFVPVVIVLAALSAGGTFLLGGDATAAMLVGLTVLIVSCPCALGLATPLAVASGVRAAAERGVVLAGESLFEDAPDVDVLVLDKTGTLTTGEMSVREVQTDDDTDSETLLSRAGALERLSAHPVAAAVTARAADAGLVPEGGAGGAEPGGAAADEGDSSDTATDGAAADGGADASSLESDEAAETAVTDFERFSRGVSGNVDGARVLVGHPGLFADRDWSIPSALATTAEGYRAAGHVPVVVGWDGRARGVVAVGDAPREAWLDAVETLSAGREVVVLTGDEGAAADRFREVDAVDEVFAGVPPEGKAETVRRLRSRGTVAVVGDGSNDAPALAAADVGIALGSGTDLATDAADAVVLEDDLTLVGEVFAVARGTNRRIKQNLAWAFGYNAVAIPLAALGLLNPLLAAVAMASSSALVVLNSSRSL